MPPLLWLLWLRLLLPPLLRLLTMTTMTTTTTTTKTTTTTTRSTRTPAAAATEAKHGRQVHSVPQTTSKTAPSRLKPPPTTATADHHGAQSLERTLGGRAAAPEKTSSVNEKRCGGVERLQGQCEKRPSPQLPQQQEARPGTGWQSPPPPRPTSPPRKTVAATHTRRLRRLFSHCCGINECLCHWRRFYAEKFTSKGENAPEKGRQPKAAKSTSYTRFWS